MGQKGLKAASKPGLVRPRMWVKIANFEVAAEIRVIGWRELRSSWYGVINRSVLRNLWGVGLGFVGYFLGRAWNRRCSEKVGYASTDA